MTTIRTYFLLASCALIAMPNQAMGASNNLLSSVRASLPSIQNISDLAVQARDAAIENRYIAVPALAVIVIGSCVYLKKRFSGRSEIVVKSSLQQDIVLQEIESEQTVPVTSDPMASGIARDMLMDWIHELTCQLEQSFLLEQINQQNYYQPDFFQFGFF